MFHFWLVITIFKLNNLYFQIKLFLKCKMVRIESPIINEEFPSTFLSSRLIKTKLFIFHWATKVTYQSRGYFTVVHLCTLRICSCIVLVSDRNCLFALFGSSVCLANATLELLISGMAETLPTFGGQRTHSRLHLRNTCAFSLLVS